MNSGDFIAEEDIFVDAKGKVVEKKDAVTKLASKGARVSPADVEKYGLQAKQQKAVVRDEGTHGAVETKMLEPSPSRSKKSRSTAGESAAEEH